MGFLKKANMVSEEKVLFLKIIMKEEVKGHIGSHIGYQFLYHIELYAEARREVVFNPPQNLDTRLVNPAYVGVKQGGVMIELKDERELLGGQVFQGEHAGEIVIYLDVRRGIGLTNNDPA